MPMPDPALNVISLANCDTTEKLAEALWEAGTSDGFFYIRDHGIPLEDVENVFEVGRGFFLGSGQDEKVKGDGDLGYTALRQETLNAEMPGNGDLKESFYLGDARWFGRQHRQQDLPPSLSAYRAKLDRFVKQNADLATIILRGLALALELPVEFLANAHQGEHSRLRLLHYPPVADHDSDNGLDIRAGAHTDYGSITILHQSRISGLQVERNGHWVDVPPIQGAVVVNIGDALEFWSGGRLRSTKHRVVMPRNEQEAVSRFSIAFFVHPEGATLFEPLTSKTGLRTEEEEREFETIISRKGLAPGTRKITSGDYLRQRIASTYAPKISCDGDGSSR